MNGPEKPGGPAGSSDRIQPRPAHEAPPGSSAKDEAVEPDRIPVGPNPPDNLGRERKEVGSAETSSRNPPHVTPNDEGAPVQDELLSPVDVPVLPANASGKDAVTTEEQREEIRDDSMYDGRPEQDKDRPPSQRGS